MKYFISALIFSVVIGCEAPETVNRQDNRHKKDSVKTDDGDYSIQDAANGAFLDNAFGESGVLGPN